MLLGVPENCMEKIERQVGSLVHTNRKVSCTLEWFLTKLDPNNPVYRQGANWLWNVSEENPTDCLANTPLKAAFQWSLSCYSAIYKVLRFATMDFNIQCKKLQPGQLFPSTDNKKYDVKGVPPGIIY